MPGRSLHTCGGWHFKLYHLSPGRHWPQRPLPPTPPPSPPLHPPDITPSLEVMLRRKMKVFPAGGCSLRPGGDRSVFHDCEIISTT